MNKTYTVENKKKDNGQIERIYTLYHDRIIQSNEVLVNLEDVEAFEECVQKFGYSRDYCKSFFDELREDLDYFLNQLEASENKQKEIQDFLHKACDLNYFTIRVCDDADYCCYNEYIMLYKKGFFVEKLAIYFHQEAGYKKALKDLGYVEGFPVSYDEFYRKKIERLNKKISDITNKIKTVEAHVPLKTQEQKCNNYYKDLLNNLIEYMCIAERPKDVANILISHGFSESDLITFGFDNSVITELSDEE